MADPADPTQPDLPVEAEGRVGVISPSGLPYNVKTEDLPIVLKEGYRLSTPPEVDEQIRAKEYGDRPVTSAALGALSGVTGGLSDVVGGQAAKEYYGGAENPIAEITARNPVSHGLGELGGYATGLGAAGLVGDVGAAAGRAAGGGFLGQVASGAAQGAAMAVPQTISTVALSNDPMNAEAISGELTRNLVFGGLAGAGAGVLAGAVAKGAEKVGQGLSDLSDKMAAKAAVPDLRATLEAQKTAELATLEAQRTAERAALVAPVKGVRDMLGPLSDTMATKLNAAPEDVLANLDRAEHAIRSQVGRITETTAAPERLLNPISDYLEHMKEALGPEPGAWAEGKLAEISQVRDRLAALAGPPSSPTLANVLQKLDALPAAGTKAGGLLGELASKGKGFAATTGAVATHGVLTALGIPGAHMFSMLAGAVLGGKAADLIGNAIASKGAELAGGIAKAAEIVGAAGRVVGSDTFIRAAAFTPEIFEDLRTKVMDAAADPAGAQQALSTQLDGVRLHDPVLADQALGHSMAIIQHLAQVMPKSPGSPTLADQSAPVSRFEQERFLRRADVAFDPKHLLAGIVEGTLTPAQVDTASALYDHFMTETRTRLISAITGKPVVADRALVLSFLLKAPATASYRPENIAASQARMSAEIQNAAAPPKPSGSGGSTAMDDLTPSQRMAGGKYR